MKTILRSYHPIPSLQRTENTRRNMQDAPRMKSLLKAVLLDGEKQSQMGPGAGAGGHNSKAKDTANADDGLEEVPTSLEILIERFARGTRPPTSVVTLVFLLSAHANQITTAHFAYPHDMHSIFFPHGQYPLSSAQRARAFLWLLYRYLEMPTSPPGTPNPFDDEVSRESGQVARARWQEMSVDERSRVGPIWKGCRRPKSEMEQERLDADGDGKMSAAPETGSEEAKVDSGSAETDEQPAPPPASQDGGVSPHSMPAPLPEEAETNAEGGAKPASEEAAAPSAPAPIENTHRELVPELTVIPHEVAALENTDEADEIAWGKRMQHERGNFLLRFQEEEQTKAGAAASIGPGKAQDAAGSASTAAGGATAANTPSQALTPSGSGRGKKRPSAGNSSYPLANILAAASAGAQLPGTAEALKRARMSVGGSARGRGVGSPQIEEDASGWGSPWAEGEPAAPSSPPRPSLWSLDITVPPHQRGESLPRLAWRRILERAQRGVGDASYDSDASDCAEEEAIDERPRGEMARILKVIRDVRTRAGDLDVPGVEGRIESQEPQRV